MVGHQLLAFNDFLCYKGKGILLLQHRLKFLNRNQSRPRSIKKLRIAVCVPPAAFSVALVHQGAAA